MFHPSIPIIFAMFDMGFDMFFDLYQDHHGCNFRMEKNVGATCVLEKSSFQPPPFGTTTAITSKEHLLF